MRTGPDFPRSRLARARPSSSIKRLRPHTTALRKYAICLGRVLGGIVRIRCPGMKPPIGVGQAHLEMLSFVRLRQMRALRG